MRHASKSLYVNGLKVRLHDATKLMRRATKSRCVYGFICATCDCCMLSQESWNHPKTCDHAMCVKIALCKRAIEWFQLSCDSMQQSHVAQIGPFTQRDFVAHRMSHRVNAGQEERPRMLDPSVAKTPTLLWRAALEHRSSTHTFKTSNFGSNFDISGIRKYLSACYNFAIACSKLRIPSVRRIWWSIKNYIFIYYKLYAL